MSDPVAGRTCFDVVNDVLAELAPEETRFLPEVWDVYRRAPAKRRTGDRTLGAGIPIDVETWTSIVLLTVGSTLLAAAQDAAKDRVRHGVAWLFRWLRACLRGNRGAEPRAPAVLPEQRAALAEAIRAKAVELGIGQDRVDALVAAAERSWLGPRAGDTGGDAGHPPAR